MNTIAEHLSATHADVVGDWSADVESFGSRLQRLRERRGLGITYLSSLVGLSRQTIWKWETDRMRPHPTHPNVVVDVLGVSRAELLVGTGLQTSLAGTAALASQPDKLQEFIAFCKKSIANLAETTADKVTINIAR